MQPFVLGLWRPKANPNNPNCFLSPAEIQMGRNNQGMLVYYGYFGDQATYNADAGLSYHRFYAYVDAQTGALLDVDYTTGWGLGLTVGSKNKVRGPLSWDWAPGPTTVSTAGFSAKAALGDVVSASAP